MVNSGGGGGESSSQIITLDLIYSEIGFIFSKELYKILASWQLSLSK